MEMPQLAASNEAPRQTSQEQALRESVELYNRTYTTVLRSSGEVKLRVFEAAHKAMGSSLHALANSAEVDLGAFLYASRRLPTGIGAVEHVVLGQSPEAFASTGYGDISHWSELRTPGRRRRWYDSGDGTLAVLIASTSDVDDLIPTLVAYQIEWNKLHLRLRSAEMSGSAVSWDFQQCAQVLGGSEDDWVQLQELWGLSFGSRLGQIAEKHLSLRVRMLGGTQVGYGKVTRRWWQQVTGTMRSENLMDRPVYFVSSNSHSLANLLTGVAAKREDQLIKYVESEGDEDLRSELARFRSGLAEGDWNNFLFFVMRQWISEQARDSSDRNAIRKEEREAGIYNVMSRTALDVSANVIVLDRLDPKNLDDRLGEINLQALKDSRAIVVNIDYPLGLAAYNILREVAETSVDLRGVYVLGKAATLNADVGDVMISSVIYDEHSGSTYWLDNAFSVGDIAPYLRFGSGLDNQRSVSVKGTFLQNRGYLDFYYREQFTVVEMEAGPYCSAMYEMSEPGRYPTGEPVNFSKLPVDFGVIHYASDTPFTQARTLGARGLSYFGMDSTYASSVAILRRILALEGIIEPRAKDRNIPIGPGDEEDA